MGGRRRGHERCVGDIDRWEGPRRVRDGRRREGEEGERGDSRRAALVHGLRSAPTPAIESVRRDARELARVSVRSSRVHCEREPSRARRQGRERRTMPIPRHSSSVRRRMTLVSGWKYWRGARDGSGVSWDARGGRRKRGRGQGTSLGTGRAPRESRGQRSCGKRATERFYGAEARAGQSKGSGGEGAAASRALLRRRLEGAGGDDSLSLSIWRGRRTCL